jgi:hypothetical protein
MFVKQDNPDDLVLVCNWAEQLTGKKGRLEIAIEQLRQHARRLILITQPPQLPESGTREAMRNGSRPPVFENPVERARRTELNAFLMSFGKGNVIVLNIEPLFVADDGSIRLIDKDGRLIYQDRDHLSDAGAELVKASLMRVISQHGAGS